MKERPILFSGEMVRAILDGRKTQTRRVVNPQPRDSQLIEECAGREWMVVKNGRPTCATGVWDTRERAYQQQIKSPYGAPGDRLWVRETFSGANSVDKLPPREWNPVAWNCPIWYWADGDPTYGDWSRPRPSIHMPRWASRITLEITGVRVEPLKEITVSDAIAEGYDGSIADPVDPSIQWYSELWNRINGADSWNSDPWVWVLEFRRVQK